LKKHKKAAEDSAAEEKKESPAQEAKEKKTKAETAIQADLLSSIVWMDA
jgi:hypothetical protein